MPLYEYVCRYHQEVTHVAIHSIADHEEYIPPRCTVPECDSPLTRDYTSVQIAPVTQSYFNHSLGVTVSDNRQLDSHLARMQDAASERLGFDQKLTLVDPSDAKHLGVTSTPDNRKTE